MAKIESLDEESPETDERQEDDRQLTYADYLHLDQLLGAQQPRSRPVHHDELLFIIQHQTSELWLKLILHELISARDGFRNDQIPLALKRLARVKHIQHTLADQWSILATLTPSEYLQFRDFLATSSGFQSYQYRAVEFILGNKDAKLITGFDHDEQASAMLAALLNSPSLYDEFLHHLSRQGYPIPTAVLNRDPTLPYVADDRLLPTFKIIYTDPQQHWAAYETCEELIDIEDNFQLWRFRHLKTVERTIGHKVGTGGSSGVDFLHKALDRTFFPELYAVRTILEPAGRRDG
ncbi:tryptophan 2,3-dioxygenase [Microlunatus elymi]|uniref:Tryptophan 2,3-dioxygenase n=1 Tax=Microlunatus elymi TaxID=2596828 RepID=A0A516PTR4_9ACTN|nr:tryptophan 2,3-dioxygenase family protein [Microlunatus elymi]QDP94567.1 tryptophan 2,3-dioxygenase [Microlunatus elymi]